jgi:hypothetical protein
MNCCVYLPLQQYPMADVNLKRAREVIDEDDDDDSGEAHERNVRATIKRPYKQVRDEVRDLRYHALHHEGMLLHHPDSFKHMLLPPWRQLLQTGRLTYYMWEKPHKCHSAWKDGQKRWQREWCLCLILDGVTYNLSLTRWDGDTEWELDTCFVNPLDGTKKKQLRLLEWNDKRLLDIRPDNWRRYWRAALARNSGDVALAILCLSAFAFMHCQGQKPSCLVRK